MSDSLKPRIAENEFRKHTPCHALCLAAANAEMLTGKRLPEVMQEPAIFGLMLTQWMRVC